MREKTFDDLTLDEIIKTLENLLKTKESNHIFINYCKEKYNIKEKDLETFVNTYHNINDSKAVDLSNAAFEKIINVAIKLPDSISIKVLKNIGRHYRNELVNYRSTDGKTILDLFIEAKKYQIAHFLNEAYQIPCNAKNKQAL